MTYDTRISLAAAILSVPFLASPASAADRIAWKRLGPGLELARIAAPEKARVGDSIITALRADLRRYRLVLHSAKFDGRANRTAAEWAAEHGLAAAINAGLYARDFKTNVGLMIDRNRVNNRRVSGMGAVFAFNPRSRRDRRARIIDRRCENFLRWRRRYRSLVQGPRLWDCRGRIMWKPERGEWSMAVLAVDRRGRVLFLYTRAPYSVYAFARMIRRLPLGVRRAMYLDGGRPSQLYVNAGGTRLELTGAFGSTGGAWVEFDARPIPNVLGLVRRK